MGEEQAQVRSLLTSKAAEILRTPLHPRLRRRSPAPERGRFWIAARARRASWCRPPRVTMASGLEFLRSIPGTVGGFVRMNGGAYGGEVKDILVDCDVVMRDGTLVTLAVEELHYSYRHSELPDGAIVVAARFCGKPGEPEAIQAEMDRISASREASQPLRSKTGGSTFKNPDGHKAWQLVDGAGCRGLQIGGAQVSEKHTNFLINTGDATSVILRNWAKKSAARVKAKSGIDLQWEIQRVGKAK